MKKQSSIEYLYERLERMMPRTSMYNIDKEDYFNQAKEMHKEEIIEARLKPLNMFKDLREKHGYFGGHDNGQVIDREINNSEYYYNKTFKSE